MEIQNLPTIAGTIASIIFVSSNLPMLFKAFKTRDLRSYSLGNISLANVGNLIQWLYISDLPLGPIWFLHGFFTITTALMLLWYLQYERDCTISSLPGCAGNLSTCLTK